MSSFFDVKKQIPKTNFEKCYQCSVNIETSLEFKVYFSLVTRKISNSIALRSNNQITEISAPWWLFLEKNPLLAPTNEIKKFYTLNKIPLGETGCLSNIYYLLAAQVSSFLIALPPFSWTQSAGTPLVLYHSLCNNCFTYGVPCDAVGYPMLPIQPFLGEQRICLGVANILRKVLFPHSYLTYNQFNQ